MYFRWTLAFVALLLVSRRPPVEIIFKKNVFSMGTRILSPRGGRIRVRIRILVVDPDSDAGGCGYVRIRVRIRFFVIDPDSDAVDILARFRLHKLIKTLDEEYPAGIHTVFRLKLMGPSVTQEMLSLL